MEQRLTGELRFRSGDFLPRCDYSLTYYLPQTDGQIRVHSLAIHNGAV